ncbi:MAG: M48 family metallopeptidase [Candidatus Saccharibacteria bacterium]
MEQDRIRKDSRLIKTEMFSLDIDGENLAVAVSWRKGIKVARIRVSEHGVSASVPRSMSRKSVSDLLGRETSWITRHWRKQRQVIADLASRPSDHFYFQGQYYRLIISTHNSVDNKERFHVENNYFILHLTRSEAAKWRIVLEDTLKSYAKTIIKQRMDQIKGIFGCDYNDVAVRDQKTRWGSCSPKKNLSFNWRLLLMPPEIMDYVIIHELCHIIELSHSKEFWRLVESVLPDFNEKRKWLRSNGRIYSEVFEAVRPAYINL